MKFKSRLFFLVSLTALLAGCTSVRKMETENSMMVSSLVSTPPKTWRPMPFIKHKDWLAMNLDFAPFDQLRKDLELVHGTPLKSRGESHLTVITPPEFDILSSVVPIDEINSVAALMNIQQTPFKMVCLARAVNPQDPKMTTYFVIVDAPGLFEIRREIFRRYAAAGGKDPDQFGNINYYPHITIAFNDRDVYESDGVIKDRRHCVMDLKTAEGDSITHWNP